jgi:hypothetical protein
MDQNEHPLEPRHLRVPSGVCKTISKPMIRLAQTMQLSCTNTNDLSKQIKTRFHKTHVTLEFYRVRPKPFPSLWHVQRKPCIYLASSLALSPNRPNRASTWASSPRSTIGCVQNDLWAYGTFGANHAYISHDANTISKQTKTRFHVTHVTQAFQRVRPKWLSEPMVRSAQTIHLSCVWICTISK